jgi:hypothetical protein
VSFWQRISGMFGVVTVGQTLWCDRCSDKCRNLRFRQYDAYRRSGFRVAPCACGGLLRNPQIGAAGLFADGRLDERK